MDLKDIFSLEGKTALVTGAARGNGRAIADGLFLAGATVYYLDIIAPESFKKSARSTFIKADIANDKDLDKVIKAIKNDGHSIDILFNNAGITIGGISSEKYSKKDWDKTMAVDLTAQFQLAQLVANEMIRSKIAGSIINITSISARFGYSDNPAYMAAKGGLVSLTRALAKDFAKYNIRVNCISPGYIRTNMTAKGYADPDARAARLERAMIKRYGEPDDLVGASILLASKASSYITGAEFVIDGGWSASGF